MGFNKIPLIGGRHSDETRNIINLMVQVINNRGVEILSESSFLSWLEENGITHEGEWDNAREYDGLSVVLHQGSSYTSTKRVPVGIDILNEDFWLETGNYNAQIEHYRQEMNTFKEKIEAKTMLSVSDFGAVGDGEVNDTQSFKEALEYSSNSHIKKVYIPPGTYKVDPNSIIVPENVTLIGSSLRDSIIRGANKTGVGVKLLSGSVAKDLYVRGYEVGIENTSYLTRIYNTKLSYNVVGATFNNHSYIVSCQGNEITFNDVGVMIGGLTYELLIKDNIIDNNKIGVIGHSSSHGFILNDNTIEGNSNRDTGVGCGLLLCGLNYSRTNIYGNWFESNGVTPSGFCVL